MKEELLLVSSNQHKLAEIKAMLPSDYVLRNLTDIHWSALIPEPFATFEENAAAKVSQVYQVTGMTCFAEDSGLEVAALDGRPGVLSARYSGNHGDSHRNMDMVLRELEGSQNRAAKFVSVIAFQPSPGDIHFFRGEINGHISHQPEGINGFGYDPIFIPDGFDQSFGQLPASLKNRISHRLKSMQQFIAYLEKWINV